MDKSHVGHHRKYDVFMIEIYYFYFLMQFVIQAGRTKCKDYVQVLPIKQIRLLA